MIPRTQPAMIIANLRTGGTFLCHCLSNHPDIFCVRGEPLHHKNIWRKMAKDPVNILKCVMGQHHYLVSMGKITYSQGFNEDIWPYLVKSQPRVIWLYRENLIRQAVSLMLVKLYHKGLSSQPVHSFLDQDPARAILNPGAVLDQVRALAQANAQAKKRMRQFEHMLPLTFADVVGGEMAKAHMLPEAAAQVICAFLGVERRRMISDLKRVNPYRHKDTLKKRADKRAVLENSEFKGMLGDE